MEFDAFRMDGLGNDFVIIDQRKRSVSLTKDQIIKICDRNFLGCDQLIFIQNSTISNASMQFYNSDGSTSGACGNGTRCVAYLISEEEKNKNISLNVDNQILNSKILDSKQVETIIGKPKLNWKDIPINRELNTRNLELTISDVDNNKITGGVGINVGNPHVIFFVNDLELFDLKKIGPQILKKGLRSEYYTDIIDYNVDGVDFYGPREGNKYCEDMYGESWRIPCTSETEYDYTSDSPGLPWWDRITFENTTTHWRK